MTDMPATADEPVRLLLVDDHPMMRKGVAQLLELEDDLSVVGEAGSGEEALRLAAELDPDMILLDLNMKGMNGLDTLRALREAGVDARIVVFTVSDDKGDVVNVLRAGADGYLLKDMEPERLLEHIRQAATGQMTLSPQLTQILAQALRGDDRSKSLDELTERERQILRQIAHGYSNKMIARKLDITEGTVKVHVSGCCTSSACVRGSRPRCGRWRTTWCEPRAGLIPVKKSTAALRRYWRLPSTRRPS